MARGGGSKNRALLFGALQTAYDNKLTSGFAGWPSQHSSPGLLVPTNEQYILARLYIGQFSSYRNWVLGLAVSK
jgi:hypothetical protein